MLVKNHFSAKASVPSALQAEFRENFDVIRQAILNVSWKPLDPTGLCHYKVILDPLPNNNDEACKNQTSASIILSKVCSSN